MNNENSQRQPGCGRPNRSLLSVWTLFHLLLLGSVLLLPASAAAARQQTLFLPLAIHGPADDAGLPAITDQALSTAVEARGERMLPREEAGQAFDYQAAWPPPPATVRAFVAGRDVDHVVIGTLTRLGSGFSIDLAVHDPLAAAPPRYFYRTADSEAAIAPALTNLVGEILTYTGRHFLIAEISVEGNRRIDSGAILRNVKSSVGEPYQPALLRQDLRNIFQMGYFDDIQIEVSDTEAGKKVTFIIVEQNIIGRVQISGQKKVKADDILQVITLRANHIIRTKEMQESVENIRDLYKGKGYYNALVTIELSEPQQGRTDVTFTIEEGGRALVREINFVGNESFSNRRLNRVISTNKKGLLSWLTKSGVLKPEVVEQDTARLTAFYHDHGYIDAAVGNPEIDLRKNRLAVTFHIAEGVRYQMGEIRFQGDLIESEETIAGLANLKNEKYFSRRLLREDILRLTDFYADQGYAFADAIPSLDRDPLQGIVHITMELRKDTRVKINRIIIEGNTRTRDRVIRREIEVEESGTFSASALRASNENLQRLGFFESVNITPLPAADEGFMDILVEVTERPTGSFRIGAGYSSVDNLLFMTEVSQDNFMGKGQRVALAANLSSRSSRYNFSFTDPRVRDSRLLFGLDLYDWNREYTHYTRDSYGFALRFGYPVWERWRAFWSYGYDDTTLENVSPGAPHLIALSQHLNVTSAVRLGFDRDLRNRRYDPTRGSYYNVSVKYAGGPLGGDAEFTKLEASSSWYFPFKWDTTFHVRVAGGLVTENKEDHLPVFERFYLGGLSTVRGFDFGEISPRAPNSNTGVLETVGGRQMWHSNLEYIFPIFKEAGLRGVLFFDLGDSIDGAVPRTEYDRIRYSAGFGFRWLSPLGPLRLEWGHNLNPVLDEKTSSWDFSIGGTF